MRVWRLGHGIVGLFLLPSAVFVTAVASLAISMFAPELAALALVVAISLAGLLLYALMKRS